MYLPNLWSEDKRYIGRSLEDIEDKDDDIDIESGYILIE